MTNEANESRGKVMMRIIERGNVLDLMADYSEILIDSGSAEEIVKLIPGAKTLLVGGKAFLSMYDELSLRKIYIFLHHLEDMTDDDRKELLNSLERQEGTRQLAGENILLLIDRHDDMTKPEYLARILVAHGKKLITYKTTKNLCSAVDRIRMHNLAALESFYGTNPDESLLDQLSLQDLAYCGLVTPKTFLGGGLYFEAQLELASNHFVKNDLGYDFVHHVLQKRTAPYTRQQEN